MEDSSSNAQSIVQYTPHPVVNEVGPINVSVVLVLQTVFIHEAYPYETIEIVGIGSCNSI